MLEITKFKNIVNGIRRHYPVSDSSINELALYFVEVHNSKNHLLTQTGIRDNYVYFIERGCARTFFFIGNSEVTNWFSKEGDLTFSSSSLYHKQPALEYVQLLEDSILYLMPIDTLNKLYETNLEIANWSRIIHQEALLKMQNLRLERLSLSAKERYEKFIIESPDLIKRVNLGFIASYLGMTQQHLSSLRAEARF
jgi:signal-transduction protein with cAMP-binding, CBS, and nucleotidyltransferase domain